MGVIRWCKRLIKTVLVVVLVLLVSSAAMVLLLKWHNPPTTSLMWQNQRSLSKGSTTEVKNSQQWVAYQNIAPAMRLAVVAAEDQRFPKHYGFDWTEVEKVLEQSKQGKALRGASTITQQLAKNLFLSRDRSWWRKGLEAWFAGLLELCLSKQRILELYLNVVQFDSRTFGVEAASWQFFERPAIALTDKQAALLASVLPAPSVHKVEAPSRHVRKKQAWVLKQMRALGPEYLEDL